MIAALAFDRPRLLSDGRTLRLPAFVLRSGLPLSAACLVANGVRETLTHLLAVEVEVDLLEPTLPLAPERRLLLEGATIYRIRGRLCDGFIIVRPADARKLVALTFNENEYAQQAPLSAIEAATLERIVLGLVPLCNPLCGTLGPVVRETNERAGCDLATYFEVRTTGLVRLGIGFGLACDPSETVGERLTLEDLAEIELEGVVEIGVGTLGVSAFSHLAPGMTIALETNLGGMGLLRFGGVALARGTCGARQGRHAFSLGAA